MPFLVLCTSALAALVSPARAYECQDLFKASNPVRTKRTFSGAVEGSHLGQTLSREIQHELISLSDTTAELSKLFPVNLAQSVPTGKELALVFKGSGHIAELTVVHSGGRWHLSTTGRGIAAGQARKLAQDIAVSDLSSRDLTLHLALHMNAIREFFEIQTAFERDDILGPLREWAKASGEDPFQSDIVQLLLASRKERFHLDRGFEKNAPMELSEKSIRKMAALTFLVQRNLVFSLGPDGQSPGVYQKMGTNAWERISSSDDNAQTDRTVLLLQAMKNAGFNYDSGTYRETTEN